MAYFLLCLLVVSALIQPGILFPQLATTRPFFLIALISLIAFILSPYSKNSRDVLKSGQGLFLLGLLSCETFAFFISEGWIRGSVDVFMDWSKLISLFLLTAAIVDSYARAKKVIWLCVLSACVVFFKAWEILRYSPELMTDNRLSAYGMYNGANDLALLLVCTWPLAFKLLEFEKAIIKRVILVGVLIFIPYLLLHTISRGGTLGFSTVLALCFITGVSGKKRLNTFKKLIIIPLLLVAIPIGLAKLETRKDAQSYSTTDASALHRIEAWKAGTHMMLDRPWGVGYKNFLEYSKKYGIGKIQAHNTLIKVGSEAGFLGLFCYLSLLYVSFKQLLAVYQKMRNGPDKDHLLLIQGLVISLTGFFICTFFSVKEFELLLYIILGLVLSLTRIEGLALNNFKKKDAFVVVTGMSALFLLIKFLPA